MDKATWVAVVGWLGDDEKAEAPFKDDIILSSHLKY